MITEAVTYVHQRRSLRALVTRPVTDEISPGDRIGDYQVVKQLGHGGFGRVYEVEDPRTGRRVALKLLHRQHALNLHIRQRFEREAWVVNGLRHRNLIELFELAAMPDGRPFYVMELLDGEDLDEQLTQRGRFAPREVVELLHSVLDALAAVHDAGVVHRDIKPSNVFLTRGGRVVLLDFGIAKPLHVTSLTRSQQQLGTPAYMAPEQILQRPVDARTDLYAVAAMAFQLLTGRAPFVASSPSEMHQRHLHAPREAPSRYAAGIPAALDAVIVKAMNADPEQRHASARELSTALREAIEVRVPDQRGAAVAMYIELADAVDAEPILKVLEHWLASRDFVPAFQTPNSLLVVRPVADPEDDRWKAVARELFAHAAESDAAIELDVHIGEVEWANGIPVGGGLLTLDWVVGAPGLHGLPEMV